MICDTHKVMLRKTRKNKLGYCPVCVQRGVQFIPTAKQIMAFKKHKK